MHNAKNNPTNVNQPLTGDPHALLDAALLADQPRHTADGVHKPHSASVPRQLAGEFASEESVYEEPIGDEPNQEEPGQEEPDHEEPDNPDPVGEEPTHEEPAGEEPGNEEPNHEEPVGEEPGYEEPTEEGNEQNQPPCDTCPCPSSQSASGRPVRYADGRVWLSQQDVSVPQGGFFGHQRFYANRPTGHVVSSSVATARAGHVNASAAKRRRGGSSGRKILKGPNGRKWMVHHSPTAQLVNGTTVAIGFDPNQTHHFRRVSNNKYVPVYGWLGTSLSVSGGHMTFTRIVDGGTEKTVLNSPYATTNPGAFVSHTDARGVTTTVVSTENSQPTEVQRSYVLNGTTILDSLVYAYVASGPGEGLAQSVTYRQSAGNGQWTPVSQVTYAYYDSGDLNGTLNDLKTVTQQSPDGSGGWATTAVEYYRYWTTSGAAGSPGLMKIHIGAEGYRQLFNAGVDVLTAADDAILPYADHYFEYDASSRVTKEISAVCDSCPGGGTTTDLFAYSTNPNQPAQDYNTWATKTVQTLPDNSQIIVYCNGYGQTMLYINVDATGTNRWATFNRYDPVEQTGRVVWEAQPSAVALPPDLLTLEQYDDLLNYDESTGRYQYLKDNDGLIKVTDYYPATGGGQSFVQNTKVRQGQAGSDVLLRSLTYTMDAASILVATDTSYPDATNTSTGITTSYAYAYFSGTTQLQQRTTTLPAVPTSQNGNGIAPTVVEQYDMLGQLVRRTDERGFVNTYTYSALGQMSQQVLDVPTSVSGSGLNLVTDFTYDSQGRLTRTLGPSHTAVVGGSATTVRKANWALYNSSTQPTAGTWAGDQVWNVIGYAVGSDSSTYAFTVVDPVLITIAGKDGRTTDQITSRRTSGSGAPSATDTCAQIDWQSWTSTLYDPQGRSVAKRVYSAVPASGVGTAGANYDETDFGYDQLERRNRLVTPDGTITRTVWTCPQRVASLWIGTDDAGAIDADPTGGGAAGNNMVLVTTNQYDGGSSGGDGNLTQQTQSVSATAGDTRATTYRYDFRDRRTGVTDAIGRYMVTTYDNLDRATQARQYSSVTGNLIGQTQTFYDDQGRVYQTLTYAVDPATGTVGNALTGNTWYDASGNALQQVAQGDGQAFAKQTYNGVGWVTGSFRGYNTASVGPFQAATPAADVIVTQSLPTYDGAGNVIALASYDRLNDASPSATGALGPSTARISYTATWYDGADRAIATAAYGAAATFALADTPPASSDTVLVTASAYDGAGRVCQETDPKGIITLTAYDSAGRTIQTVEDYGTGTLNRATNYTYTPSGQTATLTAVNPTTGNQTTTYTYGTTLSTSGVARNDLLASVAYPDSVGGSDAVSYAYNRLGQVRTVTDQRGTVRTFYYDALGRPTDDCVTTSGSGTDVAVKQIATAYEVRGMPSLITSTDSATQGGGTVLNQVRLEYNTFGQLVREQQSHSGIVGGSTPAVGYNYSTGASASNQVRPTTLVYPDARTLTYDYGASGGMNDRLGRIASIQDTTSGTTDLAGYTYTGSGMVVRIVYPEPGVWLDLWGGTSGTFAGLDRFNRIVDQRWQNDVTSTPADVDRYQYGYDRNSNRLWKGSAVAHAAGVYLDEAYTYDKLNRLTQMQRGNLSSGSIAGTPAREMDYTLDLTGNWPSYVNKTSGTTDLSQTRISNKVNEIMAIGGTPGWATPPAYDGAGNMTSFPQPASPASAFASTYDAWNRMTGVSNASDGSAVASYQYDGRGRRIVKYTAATAVTRHAYYTNSWQDIEERVDTSTAMDQQYAWGLRYVDELVCRDDATPRRLYAVQDANFNLTATCKASGGAVAERYCNSPYGEFQILSPDWAARMSSAYTWTVVFSGLATDLETQLLYNRIRIQNPSLGQFSQRDPANALISESLYAYLGGNPNSRSDYLGLSWTDCFGSPRVKGYQVCGYSIFLLTGSCCANPDVVNSAAGAYESFVQCWWKCEKDTHKSACGILLTGAEAGSVITGSASVRVMKSAAEITFKDDPYTTVGRSVGRMIGGESSGAAQVGKTLGRSGVSIGAKVGVVVFVYVEAGISWNCSMHC